MEDQEIDEQEMMGQVLIGQEEEDYAEKARTIFNLLNKFRQNPNLLAQELEGIREYLDKKTKILALPNRMPTQMMEGDPVIREAIDFLNELDPLNPLEWDDNLAASAAEHVNDIGPAGKLTYQSSDGTEPEDRIAKYGDFTDSLGENIDFGPNDAMGVIIALTLDDGEGDRAHRDNLFKADYRKVGIACGPHKSEYKMCVMDFAYDFVGRDRGKNKSKANNYNSNYNAHEGVKLQMNKNDIMNNSNFANRNNNYGYNNNANPCVKLSLEKEEFGKAQNDIKKNMGYRNNPQVDPDDNNKFEDIINRTKEEMNNLKIVEKQVEIITKIEYVYDDGSTNEVTQTESRTFKY